jgi:hypothetical protein
LVSVRLLAPVFFFFSLKALTELTVSGSLAMVFDGVERALAPVATVPIHGSQGPDALAGGGVGGGEEGSGVAAVSAHVSTGSREAKVWI